jgi:hypothetical protein
MYSQNERDDPLGLGDRSREPLLAKCERYLDSLVPCSEPIAGIVRSAVLYEPPRIERIHEVVEQLGPPRRRIHRNNDASLRTPLAISAVSGSE